MSAAADALPFRRHEPALGPAMGLSVVMHVVLICVLFFGVRFQSSPPAQVMVELWDPPPPPPPAPVVEVKPPPPPPVVKPEPEPEVKKPDIVLPEKPKPKPKPEVKKPEPKPKPEVKPKPAPKRDLAFEKQLREQVMAEQKQLMAEQKALEEQRRRLDEQRKERELKDLIARQQATARDSAVRAWQDDIMRSVRNRIVFDVDSVPGNPEAVFDVAILPSGDVVTIRKIRSSGNPAYDDAVERAIRAADPLPLPKDRSLFRRDLRLIFRPKDR